MGEVDARVGFTPLSESAQVPRRGTPCAGRIFRVDLAKPENVAATLGNSASQAVVPSRALDIVAP